MTTFKRNGNTVTAYRGCLQIGSLSWHDGIVVEIHVEARYRRQGIATALWAEASRHEPLRHSDERTKMGDAWAKAVGGEIPPLLDGEHAFPFGMEYA